MDALMTLSTQAHQLEQEFTLPMRIGQMMNFNGALRAASFADVMTAVENSLALEAP
jgi:hypothetical protein